MENRLPLLIAMLPRAFLDKNPQYRENLKANEQALVTGRDLGAWWAHLITGKNDTDYPSPFGISIMDRVIPDRNCNDALIEPRVCVCNMHDGEYHRNMSALKTSVNYLYHGCLNTD